MFSYDYCEIFKNSFFYRTPSVAAFKYCFKAIRASRLITKKSFYLVALAYLLINWIMFPIGSAVSTSDNDQVKAAGKDYMNVKPA